MKGFAVVLWIGCLLLGWQSCETIYAAGGWDLFWTLALLRFGGEVLSKCGVWLWKARIE